MSKFVAFDVETAGKERVYALQPCRARVGDAWLTSFAISYANGDDEATDLSQGDDAVRSVRARVLIGHWLREQARQGRTICTWNGPFDMAWLIAMGLRDEVFACKWLDGMLLWQHLTSAPRWLNPQSYGLKAAVAQFYPEHAGYGDDIDFQSTDPEMVAKRLEYNKADTRHTLNLCDKFWDELSPAQRRAALIEAACLPMVAEAIVEGIHMDTDAAAKLSNELLDQANLAMVRLKLVTREPLDDKVLASPVQLRELLFNKWGLTPVKWTDKGAESTDRDALSQIAHTDSRAGLLNEYREAKNNRTKFAEGAIASVAYNGDGCSRPVPRVFGTYTGRMSYSSKTGRGKEEVPTGVALHQWKRAKAFRELITVPEGYTLLEFDFAGQEFRWMAVKSNDPTMLQLCAPGEDMHAFMGARINSMAYHDLIAAVAASVEGAYDKRQFGKVANLSLQYRTSAPTLVRVARTQYGMTMSDREARTIRSTYLRTYTRVPRYWDDAIKSAKLCGYAETVAGRRIHLGTGDSWPPEFGWSMESTAINSPIQGSGADQKYLAMLVAKDYLPSVGGRFYFELHDGIFFIVPDANAQKAAEEMLVMLSNLPYKKAWGVNLPIAFPVDGKMGKTWGGLQKL